MAKKSSKYFLDFEVDKLTNSIENTITGDSHSTEVSLLTKNDLKLIIKKNGWKFNWKQEYGYPDRDVFKLTIPNNATIIQGLISITDKPGHIFMHLIENAPFNIGKAKVYNGVAGNLIAYACKISFQRGHEGYVSFTAKTKLVDHYVESLGAIHFGNQIMVIETPAALRLVNKYF